MRFVYVSTAAASDPTKVSLPYHIAVNGSLEAGQEATIVLGGDGAEVVLGDTLETLEGVGIPPLRDLVAKARDNGVPVYV